MSGSSASEMRGLVVNGPIAVVSAVTSFVIYQPLRHLLFAGPVMSLRRALGVQCPGLALVLVFHQTAKEALWHWRNIDKSLYYTIHGPTATAADEAVVGVGAGALTGVSMGFLSAFLFKVPVRLVMASSFVRYSVLFGIYDSQLSSVYYDNRMTRRRTPLWHALPSQAIELLRGLLLTWGVASVAGLAAYPVDVMTERRLEALAVKATNGGVHKPPRVVRVGLSRALQNVARAQIPIAAGVLLFDLATNVVDQWRNFAGGAVVH